MQSDTSSVSHSEMTQSKVDVQILKEGRKMSNVAERL